MKVEPTAHAIDPGGAAQLGIAVVSNPTPLGAGRGYMAPAPVSCTTSNCGSQGKH
jgi:hypothetical protein